VARGEGEGLLGGEGRGVGGGDTFISAGDNL